MVKNIDVDNKELVDFVKNMKNVEKVKALDNLLDKANKSTRGLQGLNKSLLRTAMVAGMLRKGVDLIKGGYADLEKSVYDLGIVSDMSLTQINTLKNELIDISATSKISAKEIADAMNMISRTGTSYNEAQKITEAGMKLAVASGEDLNSTLSVVTKALVAFDINSESAEKTFNKFHSYV